MADLDNLEYFVKFPNPNFDYKRSKSENDFVFVENEEKLPVILLFGWAGCQDKYLSKYSQIYEEKGLITLRYTAPLACLFFKISQMEIIGEKLVQLLVDLNFEKHPIIVHCFSNGGAFLYQHFSLALPKCSKPLQIKGIIFDSAPGKRRISKLFSAMRVILGGNSYYNLPMSLLWTVFVSMLWLYEIVCNYIWSTATYRTDPLEHLKNEPNRWPQHFIYSNGDVLIPSTDIEDFANYRKSLGIDVSTLCYEYSQHVKHLSENRESYISSVCNFINRCLNGKIK